MPLSEDQIPHIVEKPKNRRDAMEPKEASCGLHTLEVIGSGPGADRAHHLEHRRTNIEHGMGGIHGNAGSTL